MGRSQDDLNQEAARVTEMLQDKSVVRVREIDPARS